MARVNFPNFVETVLQRLGLLFVIFNVVDLVLELLVLRENRDVLRVFGAVWEHFEIVGGFVG